MKDINKISLLISKFKVFNEKNYSINIKKNSLEGLNNQLKNFNCK